MHSMLDFRPHSRRPRAAGVVGRAWRLVSLWLALVLLAPLATQAQQQQFLDPKIAFQPSVRALDDRTLEIRYQIADGYYLYKDKFRVTADEATFGPLQAPKGKVKPDPNFGDVEVFFKSVTLQVPVNRAEIPGPLNLALRVTSQGCADGGICYPPGTAELAVTLPALGSVVPTTPPAVTTGGDETASVARLLEGASFWLVIVSFFGFGLLLSLTPCMLPMLPILSGIIVGHGQRAGGKLSRGRGLALSLAYVLGMAITYAAIGVAAGLSGTLISASLQNAWVLSAFGLVFVVLSLSMFGFYELQLPSFLQSKLSDEANHFQGGTFYGVATMGAISALIVGPCVAAPLAGALLYIGQTGNAVLGGTALFVMALGMGVPLMLVGLSAGTLIPRAGPWMSAINKGFGVLLLATALWFVSPVLPAWLVMLGWAALLIVPAVFLHALDSLPATARGWHRFWKGVGVFMLLYGAALIVGTLAGGRDPLQPLTTLAQARGGNSVAAAASTKLPYVRVRNVMELESQLAQATRPVMLDFYADWCVSCKELERFTFSDPGIRARLDQYVVLQADVTDNNADDAALLKRFNLFGPPGLIFFAPGGREVTDVRVVGFQNVEAFGKSLDRVDAALGQRI